MAKMNDRKKALDAEISRTMMTDVERLEQEFVTYWKPIAATAVGLAILIAAICWAAAYQKRVTRQAREALAGAAQIETLEKALVDYGSTPAAPAARFRLAGLYLQKKEYAKAIAQLKQIGDANHDAYLAANAVLTEAYALELSGKTVDAAAKFAALSKQTTVPESIRAEARFSAARLYVQKKDLKEAAALLAAARANGSPKNVADSWNEESASLLRAVEAGEYGPYKAPKTMIR